MSEALIMQPLDLVISKSLDKSGSLSDEERIIDLIADLLIYCKWQGIDHEAVMRMAETHVNHETE